MAPRGQPLLGSDTTLSEIGQAREARDMGLSGPNPEKFLANQDELVTLGQRLPQRHSSHLLFLQKQVGIAVRLTFETLEGQKTSTELTVVNNGTAAIWYDWRRQFQPDCFQDLKKNRAQRFYFNNREGT